MDRDDEHLRLLSIFHYIAAGMAALFSCFPLFYLAIGIAFLSMPGKFGNGRQGQPDEVIGWMFAVMGGAFALGVWAYAACLVWAGRCLARRKRHLLCMVAACVSCLFVPFGTVLGVFTLIVLVRPSVKELFEVAGRERP